MRILVAIMDSGGSVLWSFVCRRYKLHSEGAPIYTSASRFNIVNNNINNNGIKTKANNLRCTFQDCTS